jgi:hypothetical protein
MMSMHNRNMYIIQSHTKLRLLQTRRTSRALPRELVMDFPRIAVEISDGFLLYYCYDYYGAQSI